MTHITKKEDSIKEKVFEYFKGIKSEWFKITWPEKNQVFVETLYVIIIVFIFTIVILLLDLIYKGLFKLLHLQ